jgi:hypothetical protein
VLRSLRNGRGGPTFAVRVLAALVALGLFALTAPVVLLPVFRWLYDLVL